MKRFCLDFYVFVDARSAPNAKLVQGNIEKDLRQHLAQHPRFGGLTVTVERGEVAEWSE